MGSHLESSDQLHRQPLDTDPLPAQSPPTKTRQSRIISSVLSPAVRLWLRSQVEHVEDLQFQIEGGDRQLLSGHVQRVTIAARKAVYQGLHLTQVNLTGEGIRINLGQVIKGQPLRLLEPFPVGGELQLHEADLNASLKAPLLAKALTDFLLTLLQSGDGADLVGDVAESVAGATLDLQNPQVVIGQGQLTLSATLVSVSGNTTPITIRTGLQLASNHELKLDRPQWLPTATAQRGFPLQDLDGFVIDLGPEVNLQELTLEPGCLICRGQVRVIPAE